MTTVMQLGERSVAITFEPLHPDLQPYRQVVKDGALGMDVVRHPLVYSVPHHHALNHMVNQQYIAKLDAVEKARRSGDVARFIAMHERPYRPEALSRWFAEGRFGDDAKSYWQQVGDVWIDTEFPHAHDALWRALWRGPPQFQAHRQLAMTEEDRRELEAMPEVFWIFRGQSPRHTPGMSWTTDEEKARWFAMRFADKRGQVYYGKVKKADVLAYLKGRGEHEIVVLPRSVNITGARSARRKRAA